MKVKTALYYRNKLDEHDKTVYDILADRWMRFHGKINIPTPHCELSKIIKAVHLDYPILFYINYYNVSYSKSSSGTKITGGYLYTKDEAKSFLKSCEEWGNYICGHIPRGLGMKEKALWLHDVLIKNVTYSSADKIKAHNLVGVVAEKRAVCEGIAMAYKYLCDISDIPCIYVSGTLDNERHGWNMVWIDNTPFFTDVTNDIGADGKATRRYFLKSSAEMIGYDWNKELLPKCTAQCSDSFFATAYSRNKAFMILNGIDNRCSSIKRI